MVFVVVVVCYYVFFLLCTFFSPHFCSVAFLILNCVFGFFSVDVAIITYKYVFHWSFDNRILLIFKIKIQWVLLVLNFFFHNQTLFQKLALYIYWTWKRVCFARTTKRDIIFNRQTVHFAYRTDRMRKRTHKKKCWEMIVVVVVLCYFFFRWNSPNKSNATHLHECQKERKESQCFKMIQIQHCVL